MVSAVVAPCDIRIVGVMLFMIYWMLMDLGTLVMDVYMVAVAAVVPWLPGILWL